MAAATQSAVDELAASQQNGNEEDPYQVYTLRRPHERASSVVPQLPKQPEMADTRLRYRRIAPDVPPDSIGDSSLGQNFPAPFDFPSRPSQLDPLTSDDEPSSFAVRSPRASRHNLSPPQQPHNSPHQQHTGQFSMNINGNSNNNTSARSLLSARSFVSAKTHHTSNTSSTTSTTNSTTTPKAHHGKHSNNNNQANNGNVFIFDPPPTTSISLSPPLPPLPAVELNDTAAPMLLPPTQLPASLELDGYEEGMPPPRRRSRRRPRSSTPLSTSPTTPDASSSLSHSKAMTNPSLETSDNKVSTSAPVNAARTADGRVIAAPAALPPALRAAFVLREEVPGQQVSRLSSSSSDDYNENNEFEQADDNRSASVAAKSLSIASSGGGTTTTTGTGMSRTASRRKKNSNTGGNNDGTRNLRGNSRRSARRHHSTYAGSVAAGKIISSKAHNQNYLGVGLVEYGAGSGSSSSSPSPSPLPLEERDEEFDDMDEDENGRRKKKSLNGTSTSSKSKKKNKKQHREREQQVGREHDQHRRRQVVGLDDEESGGSSGLEHTLAVDKEELSAAYVAERPGRRAGGTGMEVVAEGSGTGRSGGAGGVHRLLHALSFAKRLSSRH